MISNDIPFQTIDWAAIPKIEYKGEFVSELQNGEEFTLKKGMTYVVSDELSSHPSSTENGVKVMIIDGDFLKQK